MPKAGRSKYYAVRIGREGPQIYVSWDECKANVSRFPGAVHKSFTARAEAEAWLHVEKPIFPHNSGITPTDLRSTSTRELVTCTKAAKSLEYSSAHASISGPSVLAASHDYSQKDSVGTTKNKMPEMDFIPLDGPLLPQMPLSDEQSQVLDLVKRRRSIFFTGSAGTGKSVLLREIIRICGGRSSGELAITASTGIASVNIGGTTLHSWAGIGLGQEEAHKLAGKFLGQPKFKNVVDRWREVKTLVIDEISMLDGVLFDKLEEIARIVRRNPAPFGGIQLVLSGDFCQLPPVPDRKNGMVVQSRFAFEANTWRRCVNQPVVLTKVFRQKDQAFVDMLNSMRFGKLDPKSVEAFRKLSRPVKYTDGIGPTQLYPTRKEVDLANSQRLRELPDQIVRYPAADSPGRDSNGRPISLEQMARLLERLVVPPVIDLKIGAQVMLIKNMIQGELVNGSVGTIVRFSTSKEAVQTKTEIATEGGQKDEAPRFLDLSNDTVWPVVRFTSGRTLLCIPVDFTINNADGETEARRRQIPLILAWALSVHKSQGQTLERVKVDLARTFEKGQAYVALSRATSMESLEILNFHPSKVMAHPRVLAWHDDLDHELDMDPDFDEMDADDAVDAFWN